MLQFCLIGLNKNWYCENDEDNEDEKVNDGEEEDFFVKNASNDQIYEPAKFGDVNSILQWDQIVMATSILQGVS